MRINILYEDNHLLVAVKPSGILSQADGTNHDDMLSLLKQYLKEKYNKPGNVYLGLVHRLDQPTSGVMVFAKTSKAASRLSEQVRNHTFKKSYLLICHGRLNKREGKMEDFLVKEKEKVVVAKEGQHALLSYDVLSYCAQEDISLVKVDLKTGRKHQIRVQFASRGYPILGDNRYGEKEKMDLCLCACAISFLHPVSKERLTFTVQPPNKGKWTRFTM